MIIFCVLTFFKLTKQASITIRFTREHNKKKKKKKQETQNIGEIPIINQPALDLIQLTTHT
jgi:hypothetical protein